MPRETTPPQDSSDKIRVEYLRSVLKKDETYSVPRTTIEMQADGSNIHVTVDLFFQVLRVEHGAHKPKLLKTFKDEADPKVYDGILTQYMEVHNRPRPGCVVAFFDSDPSTINIHDLSSFDQVEQSLMKWVVNPSATAGCVDLSGSSRAIPVAAILDIDCPVFTILRALRNRGWKPQALSVVHDSLAIGDFDYRQPHSKRLFTFNAFSLWKTLYETTLLSNQTSRTHTFSCLRRASSSRLGSETKLTKTS